MHETAEYGIAAHVIYKEGAQHQGRPRAGEDDLAAPAARGRGRPGPDRVPRVAQGRPVRGRGVRVHAEGRGEEPVGRLDAARLRLRRPHRRRPPLRRREGERQDRPAPLPAEVGRHRRDPDREAGARAVARLAGAGAHQPGPQQDPRLPEARAPRRTPSAAAASSSRTRSASAACRRSGSPPRRCSPTSRARWASARPTTSTSPSARARSRRRRSPTRSSSVSSRARRSPATRPRRGSQGVLEGRDERQRRTQEASDYGIKVKGVDDVMVRLAKCCRPVPGRPDRRLRLARARDHDPPRGLQEHDRAEEVPGAVHRGRVGGRQRDLLPRRAPGRRLGSHPPARGPLADLRRDRA